MWAKDTYSAIWDEELLHKKLCETKYNKEINLRIKERMAV